MTKGVLLRIFVLQGQRHHGELLYDWLLRRARQMGIKGGAVFREIAGYGRHDRLHEQFFSNWRVTCQSKWYLRQLRRTVKKFWIFSHASPCRYFTSGVHASSAM